MFQPAAADESDPDRPADDDAVSPGGAEDELSSELQAAPDEPASDGAGEAHEAEPADAIEPAAAEEPPARAGSDLPGDDAEPSASVSGAQREEAPGAGADETAELSASQSHEDEDQEDDDAVPFPQPAQPGPVMLDAITVQEVPQQEAQEAGEVREAGAPQDAPGDQDAPQAPEDREAEEDEGDRVSPQQGAEEAREQAPSPVKPARDVALGAATAEGLSTMTPVTRVREAPQRTLGEVVLSITGLSKQFGTELAVNEIDLQLRRGSFTGIVGPNGAGKTTTISMATGLLRPTSGTVEVLGIDVWQDATAARRHIGILPDRLRLFDQLTGAQLLYYTGVLRGLTAEEARSRTGSLLHAFSLEADANRLVVDYSAGMTKKVALASALIHSPELLVLDEPFESIDPVSASQLTDILFEYVQRGGSVLLSSHSMDLVQRVCDHVAVIVRGEIVASGTVDEVRGDVTLDERFRDIVRGPDRTEGLDWLGISFS